MGCLGGPWFCFIHWTLSTDGMGCFVLSISIYCFTCYVTCFTCCILFCLFLNFVFFCWKFQMGCLGGPWFCFIHWTLSMAGMGCFVLSISIYCFTC